MLENYKRFRPGRLDVVLVELWLFALVDLGFGNVVQLDADAV